MTDMPAYEVSFCGVPAAICGSEEDAEKFLIETCGAPENLSGQALIKTAGATITAVHSESQSL